MLPHGSITFDNPDHLGRINKWGTGHTFRFQADRYDNSLSPDTWAYCWIMEGCEIVPGINALSLAGTPRRKSLTKDDFTYPYGIGSKAWRVECPDAHPSASWLSYIETSPGKTGKAVHSKIIEPRFCLSFIEFSPPPNQTIDVWTIIEFACATGVYTVRFPFNTDSDKYPELWIDGSFRDRYERVDSSVAGGVDGPRRWRLWFEEADGILIIQTSMMKEPWIFEPRYNPETMEDERLGPGRLAVEFAGRAGMFSFEPIEYAESGTAVPNRFLDWSALVSRVDDNTHLVSEAAPVYSLAYSQLPTSVGLMEVEAETQGTNLRSRPKVTLTRTANQKRPFVYLVHETREATFSAARSTPVSTQGAGDLISFGWERQLYRGCRFHASIRDKNASWVTYLKMNGAASLQAGWDGNLINIMTGYLSNPVPTKKADVDFGLIAAVDIEASDYITARMLDKKVSAWSCTPEGWNLGTWVTFMLRKAGWAGKITIPSGPVVSRSVTHRKEAIWQAAESDDLIRYLDAVLDSYAWVPVSVSVDGAIWTCPKSAVVCNTWTLDESLATGTNIIEEISFAANTENYRTVIGADSGQKNMAMVGYWDPAWRDPTSPYFVGDDWWETIDVASVQDANTALLTALADRMKRQGGVVWSRGMLPTILPGDMVTVNVSGLGVPPGTVFRVIHESGGIDETGRDFSRITGEVV